MLKTIRPVKGKEIRNDLTDISNTQPKMKIPPAPKRQRGNGWGLLLGGNEGSTEWDRLFRRPVGFKGLNIGLAFGDPEDDEIRIFCD